MIFFGRKITLVSAMLVGLVIGQTPVRASSDTAATIDVLALSFGIKLTDVAIQTGQRPLSTEFSKIFRSRNSLTPNAVSQYIQKYPSELLAFRNYSQQLHDSGYLSYSETLDLVKSAFLGFAKNQSTNSNNLTTEKSTLPSSTNAEVTTANSASELAVKSAIAESRSNDTQSPVLYEFGENIQKEQDEAAKIEAARLMAELEADKKRKRVEAQAAYLMQQLAKSKQPRQTLMERVNSILNQHTQDVVQKKADEVFDNAEISITSTDQGPEFNARVLKSFDVNPNDGLFNYGELGLVDIDDRQTLNAGFGVRMLDPTERVMYGANVFFDQEFPYGHQRASIGVEMTTSPFRFNANRYYALSGGKGLAGDITETAMSGQDIKTKIAFPYLPYLFLDYSKFKWFGEDGSPDINGQTVGLSGALSDSLSVEFARKTYSNDDLVSQNSARLTYHYIPGSEKSSSIFAPSSVPYTLEKLDAREKYAMTNRENEIQKQQTTPGLRVTFTSL